MAYGRRRQQLGQAGSSGASLAVEGAVGLAVVGGRAPSRAQDQAASAGGQEQPRSIWSLSSGLGFEVVYMGH